MQHPSFLSEPHQHSSHWQPLQIWGNLDTQIGECGEQKVTFMQAKTGKRVGR